MASDPVQVLVVLTPKEGKLDDVLAICREGAEYHKGLPECTKWLCSLEMNAKDGAQTVVIVQEWISVEALVIHGREERSVKTRDQISEVATTEFKMSKVFTGFSQKE